MRHETEIKPCEIITITADNGLGYATASADRVWCTCGYVSPPYVLHAEAVRDAEVHKAVWNDAAHDTGE